MTDGFCGTLMPPMAANAGVVPTACSFRSVRCRCPCSRSVTDDLKRGS
ncbi:MULTISPECIES: 5-oxoproline transporter, DUF979 family subunit [Burkholderia cepacia complex]